MYIKGIGVVSALGRGIDSCEKALHDVDVPEKYCVDADVLSGGKLPKKMRRADRFSKIATLAAMDAVEDSKVDIKKGTLGIILSTALGPHVTTFNFLDDLVSYGEENVSPITFSHSVHNAAVSYISMALDNQGPSITVAGFVFSFHQALLVARSWLDEKRCENVLVGSVDERGELMDDVFHNMVKKEQGIKSFDFPVTSSIDPGEGGVFFMLSNNGSQEKYCKVAEVLHDRNTDIKNDEETDIYMLDTDGMSGEDKGYLEIIKKKEQVAGYAPLFGNTSVLSAFHCAVGALSIKNQRLYTCPEQNNPHGLDLCAKEKTMDIRNIACVKYNCLRERGYIRLEK